MKVLLIYLGIGGGGEIYSLSVAKMLAQYTEMRVIISKHTENIESWRSDIGDLYEIDTHTSRFEFIKKILMRKTIQEIETIIREETPDIIYYPMLSSWTPLINRRVTDTRIVTTIHELRLPKGARSIVNSYVTQKSIKQSDGIIFLNETSREEFVLSRGHILTDVIPLGAFDFYLKGEEYQYSAVDGRANILFFGVIRNTKGLGILLRAFLQIKESVPHSKLTIAGFGNISPYRRQLNLCSDVEVHNRNLNNEEIDALMKEGDVLVLPYIYASQSGVLTLGQAYGIPILATRIRGIREQIEDGVTGVLVEPGNSEQLAMECIRMLQDPESRELLSRNEIKFARDSLSWEHVAQSIVSFFEKVLLATSRVE